MKDKPIVIAGNGPSLAQIDYRRLPADCDVFRCNQFYFEDKYFLGRHVTAVFLHAWLVKHQYFTLRTLEKREEYTFDQMYYFLTVPDFYRVYPNIEGDYPRLKSTYSHWAAVPQFLELSRFLDVYYQKQFTSGIRMLISALGLGYREIYLCGIDFYTGGGVDYAFDSLKPNLICAHSEFALGQRSPYHEKDIDLMAITLAQEISGVKIYSISEISPINEYVPLAPILNEKLFSPLDKSQNAVCDFCPLPNINIPVPGESKRMRFFREHDLLDEYTRLKGTIYVRLLKDFCILIRDMLRIIQKLLTARKKNKS